LTRESTSSRGAAEKWKLMLVSVPPVESDSGWDSQRRGAPRLKPQAENLRPVFSHAQVSPVDSLPP
jgi:hypothetical protein